MDDTYLGDLVWSGTVLLKAVAKTPVKPAPKPKDQSKGKSKTRARRTSESQASFPFTRLPFEMQKEVFQYLLVADDDHVLGPEKAHEIDNPACYEPRYQNHGYNYHLMRYDVQPPSDPPKSLRCYHKTLETQILLVSHSVHSVAVQALYGCNRFYFSSASLFNQFTNTISPMGVQSLRYLVIDYPLPRSFQVASLRRLVMGTEILDLQTLELNMLNENKERRANLHGMSSCRLHTTKGPSQAAERFVDLLDGLKQTDSIGNNEILMTINEKFDVNRAEVEEQLLAAAKIVESGRYAGVAKYCKIKLTRKRE